MPSAVHPPGSGSLDPPRPHPGCLLRAHVLVCLSFFFLLALRRHGLTGTEGRSGRKGRRDGGREEGAGGGGRARAGGGSLRRLSGVMRRQLSKRERRRAPMSERRRLGSLQAFPPYESTMRRAWRPRILPAPSVWALLSRRPEPSSLPVVIPPNPLLLSWLLPPRTLA